MIEHIGQLRRRDRYRPLGWRGPYEPTALQPLRIERHANPVVPGDFDQVASGAAKNVQIAGVRVATRPVDFRRGADGLARTVQSILQQDPFSGTVFVFRSKRADRVKLLVYDGTGLVLIWKRLEGGTFKWPPVSDGVMRLSGAQLAVLFDHAS